MPPAKKQYKKKTTKKTSKKTRKGNVPEWGSMSCKRTINPGPGSSYTVNQLYSMTTTNLAMFPRAINLANAYQHYRIKNIKITWLPQYDTFTASGGSGSKPSLYYMIDKSGGVPNNVSLEGLKNMGARPVALDEKPIVRSWSPSVLEGVLNVGSILGAKYKVSPWLSTDNTILSAGFASSTINHLGIYWFVDQADPLAGSPYNYKVEIEVQLQFKKPLVTGMVSTVQAIEGIPVELNNSPDGLVGGADESPH